MPIISAEKCLTLGIRIFEAAGVSKEEASVVSNHLVEASLAGVDSHGVIRIPLYASRVLGEPTGLVKHHDSIRIKPKATVRVVKSAGATAQVDGDWGFGILAAIKAMETAIAKAREFGVGIVTGRNCDHICRVAAYPLMAAEKNMIGATFVKTSPVMAAFGGKSRLIGNNPISFAIPTGMKNPIVLDYAMSVVAGGKIMLAAAKGESIPEGWLLDVNGKPTTSTKDWKEGGAYLPFGGHKGYALGVVNEVLGGILSGAGALMDYGGVNAFLAMALNVESFTPIDEFKSQVDKMIDTIKNAPKAPGVNEILIPGEPEFRSRERRLKEGIPIPDGEWEQFKKIATRLKISLSD